MYIQVVEYLLAVKQNEFSSPAEAWEYLKCILLNEVNLRMLYPMCFQPRSWEGKIMDTTKRSVVARAWNRVGRIGRAQRLFLNFYYYYYFLGHANVLGQGSNPYHSSDSSHSSDNTVSSTARPPGNPWTFSTSFQNLLLQKWHPEVA